MVTGSDQGVPPLSSIVSVQITVGDVNDNAPRFSQNVYTSSVPEFLATGASATRVSGLAEWHSATLKLKAFLQLMCFINHKHPLMFTIRELQEQHQSTHNYAFVYLLILGQLCA